MRRQRGARSSPATLCVLGLCALVLAGCAAPPETPEPFADAGASVPDWVARALANGDDHDHYDVAQHVGLSTSNFEVAGWDPLFTEDSGAQAGGYECGDLATKEGRTLAVVNAFTSDVAFVLMDVTDPARPQTVGELVMPQTHVYDVAMTADQRHVLLVTSPFGSIDEVNVRPPNARVAASFRDACTGVTRELAGAEAALPYHSGVVLVDIADPRAPSIVDYLALPVMGGHSIVVRDIGGDPVALVSVVGADPATDYYVFLGLRATPLGDRLELYSIYEPEPALEPLGSPGYGHEGWLHVHPATGAPTAYLADGPAGITILDISDPREPRALSHWNDATSIANPGPAEHFTHTVFPIDTLWDGRHYSFVTEECFARLSETPTCLLYVLDTTDPAAPTLVAAWTLPVELGTWAWPTFTPHYVAVLDRTLFLAHMHAGLWAFDVSSADAIADLTPLGVFLPDRDSGYTPSELRGEFDEVDQRPLVADVLVHAEHLVTFDATGGVYVLRFDPTRPAPAPVPWPLGLREGKR